MKATGTQRLVLWAGCVLVLAGGLGNAFASGETAGEKQPLNFVLILVDDKY